MSNAARAIPAAWLRIAFRTLLVTAAAWAAPAAAQVANVSFVANREFPAGQVAGGIVVADFNGDGKLDLATLNSASVSVLINRGDGTYLPPVSYDVGNTPTYISIGDFNGDGKVDIAVLSESSSSVRFGSSRKWRRDISDSKNNCHNDGQFTRFACNR